MIQPRKKFSERKPQTPIQKFLKLLADAVVQELISQQAQSKSAEHQNPSSSETPIKENRSKKHK